MRREEPTDDAPPPPPPPPRAPPRAPSDGTGEKETPGRPVGAPGTRAGGAGRREHGTGQKRQGREPGSHPEVGSSKKKNTVPCAPTALDHTTRPAPNYFAPCAPTADSAAGWGGTRVRKKRSPQQPSHRARCLATCSHRARIVNAPSGRNNKVCRVEQPDDPPPPQPPPAPQDPYTRVGRERGKWEACRNPGCKSGIGRRGRRKTHRALRAQSPKPSNVLRTRRQRTEQAHSRQRGRVGGLLSTRRHHPPPPEKKRAPRSRRHTA